MPDYPQNGNIDNLKDFQLTTNVKGKLDPSVGGKIAQQVDMQMTGVSNYFFLRNQRYRLNRAIASGRVNMGKFQDLLEMNGQVNYTNLLWKSIMIGSTLVSRLVGKWMGRNEKIQVRAVDPDSLTAKVQNQKEAEFILHTKDLHEQLEQASGLPMTGKDQFIPEDKDAIELWKAEWQALPDEIATEEHINNVIEANGFGNGGVMKEKSLHDSAETGLVAVKTYMDNKGVIKLKWVKPENAIYSYTEYPDITNHCAYCGEVITMTITEIREMFPDMPEEKLFELATTAKEYQLPDKILWVNQWNTSIVRPYDDWNIDLIDFELKSYDKETYLITETRKNKSTIIEKDVSASVKINDNQKLQTKDRVTIYHGLYARQKKEMLTWEVKKNMIRPLDPKNLGDALFSYSFYMYQNWDMKNLAVPEKIEEPLDQMILARLKMQQLVAKMRPTGAQINIDALNELDLGIGDSTPLDIQKVYDQTGILYYRGKDAAGDPIPVPISELANSGFLGQMQGLIAIYQFHYQVLKDEVGEDPNLMQAATRPRVTEGNVNTAVQQADDATDYMYDAYLHVMEDTATKIASLTRLSVIGEAGVYRSLTKDQVLNKTYTTAIRELPDDQELAQLQMMLNNALQVNPDFIMYIDPFKCMRMAKENLKLGEAYFRSCQRKAISSMQQIAQQNQQQNAQVQVQSLQAKAQADAQLTQMKGDYDIQSKKISADGLDKNALITGIMQMYVESMKSGVPIPAAIQPLADAVFKNQLLPIAMQTHIDQQQAAQALQMEQQGQQQAQQQQMMGQQAGQPQQQEPPEQEQQEQPMQQQAA